MNIHNEALGSKRFSRFVFEFSIYTREREYFSSKFSLQYEIWIWIWVYVELVGRSTAHIDWYWCFIYFLCSFVLYISFSYFMHVSYFIFHISYYLSQHVQGDLRRVRMLIPIYSSYIPYPCLIFIFHVAAFARRRPTATTHIDSYFEFFILFTSPYSYYTLQRVQGGLRRLFWEVQPRHVHALGL